MKTGLTQKQKVTEFYFNEHDDLAGTDANDRLLVTAFIGTAAWHNTILRNTI